MESGEIELCDMGIGDEDICGGCERSEDGAGDVGDEMEPAVDGVLPKDRNSEDIGVRHGGKKKETNRPSRVQSYNFNLRSRGQVVLNLATYCIDFTCVIIAMPHS